MRKSLKISIDVFQNPQLLRTLYDEVAQTLGSTYPELMAKEVDAKLIIEHEEIAYAKMRSALKKKWKELSRVYPEVEELSDLELPGFAQGYKEFKEVIRQFSFCYTTFLSHSLGNRTINIYIYLRTIHSQYQFIFLVIFGHNAFKYPT